MSTLKSIRTKSDYEIALKRIEILIAENPVLGTAAYDELDFLGSLVSAYEEIHFPI